MTDEKDDGAGLIHPAIPDVAETEPRPTWELLLLGELRVTCDAEPSGVPCTACGKSSMLHAFSKLLTDKDRELATMRHQRDQAQRNWRSWHGTAARLEDALRMTRTRDEHRQNCRVEYCATCADLQSETVRMRCDALGDETNQQPATGNQTSHGTSGSLRSEAP